MNREAELQKLTKLLEAREYYRTARLQFMAPILLELSFGTFMAFETVRDGLDGNINGRRLAGLAIVGLAATVQRKDIKRSSQNIKVVEEEISRSYNIDASRLPLAVYKHPRPQGT